MSDASVPRVTASTVRAPSPPGTAILGHANAFRRDPLGFLSEAARNFGPVVRLRVGPLIYHLVSDPRLVAEVLLERSGNYVRDTRSSRSIRLVTGESLLNAEGDAWRRHRRLAQPVFNPRRIAGFASAIAHAATETAEAWDRAAQGQTTLDLASEMSRLTFTAVGRCLFGADLGAHANEVEQALPVLLDELFLRSQSVMSLPIWLPLRRHARFTSALGVINKVVSQIIAARRGRRGAQREEGDLLDALLAARDEDGSALRDEELRDQIVTFLLAGHETTASVLTWALALLAQHPAERNAVESELDASGFAMTGTSLLDRLPALKTLHAVLQETLRLYPSIWIIERRVMSADELGGFAIPAGSSVIVAPYVTQRLAALWSDSEAFRPARFLEERAHTLSADGYFPFGAGPHACIGQHFAMMEAKIILATLSARFRVALVDSAPPVPLAGITLRPSQAVRIRLDRR